MGRRSPLRAMVKANWEKRRGPTSLAVGQKWRALRGLGRLAHSGIRHFIRKACVPAFLPWSRVREARRPEVGSRGRGALRGRRVFSPVSAVWTSGEVLRRWWGARRGGGGRCRRWRRVGHVRRHPRRWRRTRLLRPGQYIPLRASRGGAAGHAAQGCAGPQACATSTHEHTGTGLPYNTM